jgi:hypothetical protein
MDFASKPAMLLSSLTQILSRLLVSSLFPLFIHIGLHPCCLCFVLFFASLLLLFLFSLFFSFPFLLSGRSCLFHEVADLGDFILTIESSPLNPSPSNREMSEPGHSVNQK